MDFDFSALKRLKIIKKFRATVRALTSDVDEMIEEAAEESYMTFGTEKYFNRSVWEKVRDLGYLPIEIKSAPEGRKIPINNVLFTIESTEKWFAKTVNSL